MRWYVSYPDRWVFWAILLPGTVSGLLILRALQGV